MCLAYLNYIFCITCLKVAESTLGHCWSIYCIVQPLVLHIGLSLDASLPPIARLVGVKRNPDEWVAGSEWLNLATFEQMKFYTVEGGSICWIYLGNRLMPLPYVNRTSILNRANLYFLPGAEELAWPAPPPPHTHPRASSLSQPSSSHDYPDLHANLWWIQEEQACLRAYVETKHASLWGFVYEHHDELHGMIASQNQYFPDFRVFLETWWDCHISKPHPPYSPSPHPTF